LKILDPIDVQPTINPASPEHVSGRQVHRRILSALTGGPSSIDVGYNAFKAGIEINEPYAYDRDEFCFIVAGEMESTNDGAPAIATGGAFVYRPTRAATEQVKVTRDTITICAFSPARIDGWSHRLSAEEVGVWHGDEANRPAVQIIPVGERASGDSPWADVEGGVDYREVVRTQDFTLAWAALEGHSRFVRPPVDRDEVWFVVTGNLEIARPDEARVAFANRFVIWAPGDQEHDVRITEPSILAIFSAKYK
jgi:mannose-6-phosphate isomerase-like protein (cupin superfamily)